MLRDIIPAKARHYVYKAIAALSAIEVALDLVDWGLVPDAVQAKVLFVCAALGLTVAAANTPKG